MKTWGRMKAYHSLGFFSRAAPPQSSTSFIPRTYVAAHSVNAFEADVCFGYCRERSGRWQGRLPRQAERSRAKHGWYRSGMISANDARHKRGAVPLLVARSIPAFQPWSGMCCNFGNGGPGCTWRGGKRESRSAHSKASIAIWQMQTA